MNIKVDSNTDNYLNGDIQFISEIFPEESKNPCITLRKNENGVIGLHFTNWNSIESIDVYDSNASTELAESIIQALNFLKNYNQEINDNQLNLFEEIQVVREN